MKQLVIIFLLLTSLNALAVAEYDSIVAADGSGNFTTIQAALAAAPNNSGKQFTIFIKNGIYKEKLVIPAEKPNISFIGEDKNSTIIAFNDYSGKGDVNTFTSYTVLVLGSGFYAENITFSNTAGPVGQAVALHIEADKVIVNNCRLIGNQDTLYTGKEGSRQYFLSCYIEGTTDFIFGPATAVFDGCSIVSKKNSYITAASTPAGARFGFVFLNCTLRATADATKVYLGRPWRPYAKTVFINTEMGSHILPEGWHNWNKPDAEKTTFYGEFRSAGPGASVAQRVTWSRQLTDIKVYTLKNIFAGWEVLTAKMILSSNARQHSNDNALIKRDTSFTIYSAFIAAKKKYPAISVADDRIPAGVAVTTDLVYSTIGTRKLLADVYLPENTLGRPAVLMVYGGGWKSGDKSQMRAIGLKLAQQGYIAVAVAYRLSPEAKFPAALHDLKAAVRWMRVNANRFGINKDKIAVLGVSAGGQLAALVGATNKSHAFEGTGGHAKASSLVQAVIDIDGILAFKHPESAEGQVAAEWLNGTYEENKAAWEAASPLSHAGKQFPPMLFVNSQYDRFHAGRNDLIDKLKTFGIYTEVHTLPDTPHTFWLFNPWFEPTMNYVLGFLKKVNG